MSFPMEGCRCNQSLRSWGRVSINILLSPSVGHTQAQGMEGLAVYFHQLPVGLRGTALLKASEHSVSAQSRVCPPEGEGR